MFVIILKRDEDHRPISPEAWEIVSERRACLALVGRIHFARALDTAKRFCWDETPAGVLAVETDNVPGADLRSTNDCRRINFRRADIFARMRKWLDPGRYELEYVPQGDRVYWYVDLAPEADIYGWFISV